jgi:hypothetical protein
MKVAKTHAVLLFHNDPFNFQLNMTDCFHNLSPLSIGAAVGYRLTERLAENKTWNAVASNQDAAAAVAAQQLEAVKFLCKEVWTEIFHKQVDKLQTNHRGVFVLKDLELSWLTKFPTHSETSRVAAIRLLAISMRSDPWVIGQLGNSFRRFM